MGNCRFCNKPAGFLLSTHKECKAQYNEAGRDIVSLVESISSINTNVSSLRNSIIAKAQSGYINENRKKELLILGWEKAVERAFDDGILTDEEEDNLTEFMQNFSLSQEELDRNDAFSKMVKGSVLRDILEGNIPERVEIDGNMPFNLQKTEKIVWIFQDVDYYEEKTKTSYVGGSKGFSIKIAKGVYYRTGGFKGERVKTSETIHADTGLFAVTNKHIYFSGSSKRFRIAFNKIVTFEPFSDGISVQRDAQTAKPQSFTTGDGWFTYNLVTNLAQM